MWELIVGIEVNEDLSEFTKFLGVGIKQCDEVKVRLNFVIN